jgi:hypothetical protein
MSNSTQNSQSRPNRSGFSTVPTTTSTHTQTESPSTRPVLVLRAEGAVTRHIQWSEDVVDNEGMGRKSSKGECAGTFSCGMPLICQLSLLHISQAAHGGWILI